MPIDALLSAGACFALLSAVSISSVAAPRGADQWRTWAEAFTDVPTQVGAFVSVLAPGRITLRTGVGWMPEAYVELANRVASRVAEDYTQAQADAVAAALRDSLVWHTTVGWHPVADWGLHLEAGYQLLTLGGSATGAELIAIATDQSAPAREADDPPGAYDIGVTAHRLRVGLAWRWLLGADGAWSVTARLGGELTVASRCAVTPRFGGFQVRRAEAFGARAAASLDEIIGGSLHYPTVGLSLGRRLD